MSETTTTELPPATDIETERTASILAGVTRKPDDAPAANQPKAKPARKPRTTQNVALPGDKPAVSKPKSGRVAVKGDKTGPIIKPADEAPCTFKRDGQHCIGVKGHPRGQHVMRGTEPAAAPSNGATPREHNQELARKLLTAVVAEFGTASQADQQKVANWLHMLPTGGEGAGYLRYWPASFARPTSAGWRKPE